MTPITSTARITTTASTTTDAEKLLRDMAYILKLTRRVKEEMCADRAQAQAPVTNPERALVA
ncbi:hypothetical protein J8F10_22365 [Gemmata sp. G18]|uniref:Uncharacterized protein n=1 Tax=Gemmata palustris TaxID=2822762 RepID=A0ABS5BWC7_9BACT|nr:hypothetical protein [Gemmata palustris]MBP3958009.1 hypothetical protein [Gemmata palustris]